MIEVQRVHHLGIRVTDEQQAIAFYRHFGFEVERRADGDDVTILTNPSGVEINLIYNGVDDALLPPITGEALLTRAAANATWTGGPAFLAAPRKVWKVAPGDADVAGYVRVLRGVIVGITL